MIQMSLSSPTPFLGSYQFWSLKSNNGCFGILIYTHSGFEKAEVQNYFLRFKWHPITQALLLVQDLIKLAILVKKKIGGVLAVGPITGAS